MKYNVDYFIKKFSAIPEERWCVRMFDNGQGQNCAFGHLGARTGHIGALETGGFFNKVLFPEARALQELFVARGYDPTYPAFVNNGDDPNFQQATPKQRILAALHDIKASQVEVTNPPVYIEDIIPQEVEA